MRPSARVDKALRAGGDVRRARPRVDLEAAARRLDRVLEEGAHSSFFVRSGDWPGKRALGIDLFSMRAVVAAAQKRRDSCPAFGRFRRYRVEKRGSCSLGSQFIALL